MPSRNKPGSRSMRTQMKQSLLQKAQMERFRHQQELDDLRMTIAEKDAIIHILRGRLKTLKKN